MPEETTALAREVAEELQAAHPKAVTATMTKARRSGKVFLDWSQNAGSKTTISPYSLRGRELPTVAAPLTWAEVEAGADAIVAPLRADFPEAAIRVERLWDYPGLGTPVGAGVVNFVKSLTGANGTIKVAFGTEGGLFDARLGIPTVICGPGSMAQGHKPDEFVSIEQMDRCEAMLSALVARLEAGF